MVGLLLFQHIVHNYPLAITSVWLHLLPEISSYLPFFYPDPFGSQIVHLTAVTRWMNNRMDWEFGISKRKLLYTE